MSLWLHAGLRRGDRRLRSGGVTVIEGPTICRGASAVAPVQHSDGNSVIVDSPPAER